jgi:hypothetical protein
VEKIIIEACEKATQDQKDSSFTDTGVTYTSPEINGSNRDDTHNINSSYSLQDMNQPRKSRASITSPLDYGATSTMQSDGIASIRMRSFSDAGSSSSSDVNNFPKSIISRGTRASSMWEDKESIKSSNTAKSLSTTSPNISKDLSQFPEFVVLDCSFVTGFDANASVGLFKLRNKLAKQELGTSVPLPIFLFFAGKFYLMLFLLN